MSGSDKNIFNSKNLNKWNSSKKLKIVTHHWGSNWNKGFDVYKKLDDLLVDDYWGKLIDFKYIEIYQKDLNLKMQSMFLL